MQPKAVLYMSEEMAQMCILQEDRARMEAKVALTHIEPETGQEPALLEALQDAQIVITGWGSCSLSWLRHKQAPQLSLLCHCAGSVHALLPTDLRAWPELTVMTAREPLARGTAEFAFGMMLVSMKGVWRAVAAVREGRWLESEHIETMRESNRTVIGIIGASHVGRHMIRLCRCLPLDRILLYDPYITDEEAAELGVEKCSLDILMLRSHIVSCHAPATEETHHMIDTRALASLRDGAILINTSRGRLIDEAALINELRARRIYACLDVTDPEPPAVDSPLRTLPNCILTPHIAGALKENRYLLGQHVANAIEAWSDQKPIPGALPLHRRANLA